ncbi:uncharacterized protein BJ171DRAFT_472052 [Polychytrium aggregatum]|uniref:uncharacterized protein n=1 Tax=Polychytrium aggregatum TaxID=110093 RepID=UPI0022FE488B|nr:uncharacterized protein BJ171DRAFT_472052 [Polychytrium aggregatum]KAI9208397.1 hypothetical protein BJ171DRAFT_472052 [Polychytrium aggregatum]
MDSLRPHLLLPRPHRTAPQPASPAIIRSSSAEPTHSSSPEHPSLRKCSSSTPAELEDSSRVISLEELAQHNTPESLWLAYRGTVYDATGGKKMLLLGAGKDATDLINSRHPWVNVDKVLSRYGRKVGVLKRRGFGAFLSIV